MRKVGIAVALAVTLVGGRAMAQPDSTRTRDAGQGAVNVKGSLYADDDDTTVWTALADAEVALPSDARVGAHALIDVISAASVDVVSAATERFEETRIELGGRAGMYITDEVDLGVGFVHSQENDWESFSPSATITAELFKRNTTLNAGYGFSHNLVGRAEDPSFRRELDSHTAQASISQVIDDKSVLNLAYTFQASLGFQSSPYRFVTAFGGVFSTPERHPDARYRHAVTVSGLRYLVKDVGLEASYRFYGDDWGVLSHTAHAGVAAVRFADFVDLRFRGRFYYQVAADFWREQYDEQLTYMSLDRELSTFWDAGGGAKLGFRGDAMARQRQGGRALLPLRGFLAARWTCCGMVADIGGGVQMVRADSSHW